MYATDCWATDARKEWGKSGMRTTYITDARIVTQVFLTLAYTFARGVHMRSCMRSLFISVGGRGWMSPLDRAVAA